MNYNVSPTRGMKDSLPSEMERRDAATAIILDTYRSFGFNHLETPIVEHLALLSGGEGGENEKLIFKILKRGDKLENADANDLCESALRYDLTVRMGYQHLYLYGNYSMVSLFKKDKGPEVYPFTFGLGIAF